MSLTLLIQGSGAAPEGVPERTQMTGGALTLGRGAENDIKLPDPDRHLSKRHCVIEERSGVYVLIDVSTNGTFLNYGAQPVAGESPPLGDGDIVALGPYEFRVEIAETGAGVASRAADPFADLPPPLEDAPLAPAPKGGDDFVGGLDDPGSSLNDSGDDILAPFGDAPKGELAGADPFAASAGGEHGVLPEDDAFLRDLGALAPAQDESHTGGTISDHGRSEADVFETAATSRTTIPDDWDLDAPDDDGAGEDPFAAPPPAQAPAPAPPPQATAPSAAPPAAPSADPFAEEDDLLAPAPDPVAPPAPSAPAPAPAIPTGADPFAEEGDDLLAPAPAAPQAPAATPTAAPAPVQPAPPVASAAPAAAPAAASQAPVSGDAARAFLQAAGVAEDLISDAELVDVMRSSGAAFRSMVEGLREVLMTRSSIKGEFRMNQTMIQSGGNNPLKFSISGEHAVKALLKPDVAGYLSAEDAVRQGLDDVKAHEVAMVTGMQAALETLIKRFDPGSLEKRMEKSASGLGAVFRGGKKATYWDAFTQLYEDIATEAEDDFQALFGKAFAKAYEEQLRSLEGERR